MNKTMMWLPVLILSAAFSQVSFACDDKNEQCPCMHTQQLQKMQQELNLTAAQQTKIST